MLDENGFSTEQDLTKKSYGLYQHILQKTVSSYKKYNITARINRKIYV